MEQNEITMAQKQSTSEMENKYLTFWTDGQLYGVPIADVVQIIGIQEITAIPEFPSYAKGIINLRGSITPVIDVRLRFNKEEIPYNERTCIIVTKIRELLAGFIVDSVDEVTVIEEENISQPPRVGNDLDSHYVVGIGKLENRVILLLDSGLLLNDRDMEMMLNLS